MPDSLNRLVRQRNRRTNTDRQLEATERPPVTRLICFDCRQVPNWIAVHNEALRTHSPHGDDCHYGLTCGEPFDKSACPFCGGRLVEVTG